MNNPEFKQQNDGHVRVDIPPSPLGLYSYSASESFTETEHDKQVKNNTSGGRGSVSVFTKLKKQLTAELYITGKLDNESCLDITFHHQGVHI